MRKASTPERAFHFQQIPCVGPRVAGDFAVLGLRSPQDLKDKDPYELYETLCRKTKTRHDPCLLDTFICAVYFMDGKGSKPWWFFTPQRKRSPKWLNSPLNIARK